MLDHDHLRRVDGVVASLFPCPHAPGPQSAVCCYCARTSGQLHAKRWPVEERAGSMGELAEKSDPPRAIRRGDWTPTRRHAVDARTKLDRRGVKVARGTASASALSSPSSPAPAGKQPAAPEQLPALRAQPVGHHVERTRCDHHHGQHGTASINQAWGRGSRRALRAPSRGAGRHAAPSSGLRRLDGGSVVRSCAWPLAAARAPLPRRPPPASVLLRVGDSAPTVRARRVQSFLGPATRRWSSRRSTRTAGADERAARGRGPPPRHRRDLFS